MPDPFVQLFDLIILLKIRFCKIRLVSCIGFKFQTGYGGVFECFGR